MIFSKNYHLSRKSYFQFEFWPVLTPIYRTLMALTPPKSCLYQFLWSELLYKKLSISKSLKGPHRTPKT
jgi:hypothetical protein